LNFVPELGRQAKIKVQKSKAILFMKSGFCVLWGRPNVGKSTLLNALLGRKHVIVSPRPQTTRHRIAGVLNGENYQIVFLDTPGIHAPQHKLGEALVKTAKGALEDIECLLFVADATDKPHDDDIRAAQLLQRVDGSTPVLLVLNKIDAAQDISTRRKEFEKLRDFDATFEISAARGDGLEELKAAIVARLPEGEAYFPPDMIGDRSPEFHLSEFIREQALLQLRQEVPHAVAVTIEQMEPRPRGVLYIEAFLIVERSGQKQIVIGEGGARLKEIGQKARVEIEAFLGRKVYLDLRVKVRDKWREDEKWVRRLGYQEN
jgi:GTP-binding protein Era